MDAAGGRCSPDALVSGLLATDPCLPATSSLGFGAASQYHPHHRSPRDLASLSGDSSSVAFAPPLSPQASSDRPARLPAGCLLVVPTSAFWNSMPSTPEWSVWPYMRHAATALIQASDTVRRLAGNITEWPVVRTCAVARSRSVAGDGRDASELPVGASAAPYQRA